MVDFFKNAGMTIIEPNVEPWVKYAQNMYLNDAEVTKEWDLELFQKIQELAP